MGCHVYLYISLYGQAGYQSKVITDTIYSEVLKAKRAYTVYLPKSFEQNKEKRYPVLYLLHGMWEKNDVWANRGQCKRCNGLSDSEWRRLAK